ncbi:macrocin O-methyltransferase, partial [Klebsiella sp. Kps]|uniref:TylF/MycF family methyltransferase n=1 Tax=Klebsiella sp. Kps TaxID=2758579 RepID=UPI0019C0CC99
MTDAERRIVERGVQYSMTGELRLLALLDAVRYCVQRGVPGDFAECGVWRGGSVLAMILTLQELGVDDRD